jgi:hypothetical protein
MRRFPVQMDRDLDAVSHVSHVVSMHPIPTTLLFIFFGCPLCEELLLAYARIPRAHQLQLTKELITNACDGRRHPWVHFGEISSRCLSRVP